jgi:4-hydroxyacetophenone monooxygenase
MGAQPTCRARSRWRSSPTTATEEKAADWHQRSQAEMRKMAWSQPSVKHSFYKNSLGEVHILSPWRLVDYWAWTREPDPNDFVIG